MAMTLALAVTPSAQDAGWTIPEGAKDEKSPLASSPELLKKARGLFTSNCQKCHGPLGKGDGPDSKGAADLTDALRTELNPPGVLYYKIMNGHRPNMPPFKSRLSREETWTLVAYVESLRKHE